MEKNKKRADRRAHKKRMQHKAKEVIDLVWRDGSNEWEEWKNRWAVRHADNLKGCSCWMCCNPRKYGELTMQEKRISQREKFCEES